MITVPTLLIDVDKCKRNIHSMAEKARRSNVCFKPHFKTHVSHEIGEWFREEGVDAITVSSLSMACYFADKGWNDILVAFPVNILEAEKINYLAKKIQLSLLVESEETISRLSENLDSPVNVWIKIDFGYHRTGVDYSNISALTSMISAISGSKMMHFEGFLSHSGHSYNARGVKEIMEIHHDTIKKVLLLKSRFISEYPGLKISLGDTPSCSLASDFSMIDEIRPGNFVFYDLMQVYIGSCKPEEVAVAMACPVVAVHPERNEVVIYGGAVHFSKESIKDSSGRLSYGAVVEDHGSGWGDIIENAFLAKLSQEHGVVSVPSELCNRYKPGDIMKILPVHSCLTASAMNEYLTLDGKKITRQ
jgi:D-serine deaminase-like pyridoxal phosphate-dependent protein